MNKRISSRIFSYTVKSACASTRFPEPGVVFLPASGRWPDWRAGAGWIGIYVFLATLLGIFVMFALQIAAQWKTR
jgi:hypothetical protein